MLKSFTAAKPNDFNSSSAFSMNPRTCCILKVGLTAEVDDGFESTRDTEENDLTSGEKVNGDGMGAIGAMEDIRAMKASIYQQPSRQQSPKVSHV
uniref:Uncharacterized protein n=1 Tax=Noccaea caerulescens TaxID=107243 RepID=A0A1J3EHB5_NOCCA